MSADTLTERVDALMQAHTHTMPAEWGSPHLSATPISLRVRALAATVAALEDALREIALEVDSLNRTPPRPAGRRTPHRTRA